MTNPWIGIGFTLFMLVGLISILRWFKTQYNPHPELVRKLLHLLLYFNSFYRGLLVHVGLCFEAVYIMSSLVILAIKSVYPPIVIFALWITSRSLLTGFCRCWEAEEGL